MALLKIRLIFEKAKFSIQKKLFAKAICISEEETTLTSEEKHISSRQKYRIPKSLKERCKTIFDAYDVNNEGYNDISDLQLVLSCLGYSLTMFQIGRILVKLNLDNYDKIDFDEFIEIIQLYVESKNEELHGTRNKVRYSFTHSKSGTFEYQKNNDGLSDSDL